MGIKGLAHVLQPHATRLSFPEHEWPSGHPETAVARLAGARQPSLPSTVDEKDREASHILETQPASTPPGQVAVVDGPSLAYFAYHRVLALRSLGRSPLATPPDYAEVTWVAERCLEAFQEHGIQVGAIYFDGVLPNSKRPVRRQRLEASLRQLLAYRNDRSKEPWPSSSIVKEQKVVLPANFQPFSRMLPAARLSNLPALPFLVPAVLEALQSGPFKSVTTVVSGEADAYCASYAVEHASTIFTSDSDLLVYQLHPRSSVVLWKDIEQVSGTGNRIELLAYHAPSIARHFSLESLRSLAFALSQDPHNGITVSHLDKARRIEKNTTSNFARFEEEYTIPAHSTPKIAHGAFSSLDPRMSEWVHQAMWQISGARSNEAEPGVTLDMFLPVLYEDTTRVSPWQPGEALRALAYSTLLPSREHGQIRSQATFETCRKGNHLDGNTIVNFRANEVTRALISHTRTIKLVHKRIPEALRWQCLGLIPLAGFNKSVSQRSLVKAVLRRQQPPQSWEHVHLTAQVEATLYSWRMLAQCLHVKRNASSVFSEYVEGVDTLYDVLMDLPGIPKLFDPLHPIDEQVLDSAVDAVYEIMGMQEVVDDPPMSRAERKKQKKKRRKETPDEMPKNSKVIKTAHASLNMYDLLSNQE